MQLPQISDRSQSLEKNDKGVHVVEESEVDSLNSDSSFNVFKDPVVAEHYRQVYEKSQYECRHLFDPDFSWDELEEKKITRKNDWYVTLWALIMFIALDFDRSNISQALSDNMLGDLNLTTNDYNTGSTINLVCFLSAELPSQLISKKIGPDIWVPMQLVLWSIVSIFQSTISTKVGFFVTRALLGLFQGGFICDVCLWLSYFYTSKELPLRMGIFYIANPLTTVLSSLLSLGLLKIRTDTIKHGWRWLFIIEGVMTLVVGFASFFKMPASSVQTKTWFRKKGWYTDREEKILVNKVLRDDPAKGDLNNRQPVTIKELFKALLDYDMAWIYICRLLVDIGTSPVSSYLTLLLKQMGYSTSATNALAIPYNALIIFNLVFTTYLSQKYNFVAYMIASIPAWAIITLFPLRFWPGAQTDKWGTWVLLTIVLGHAPSWPLSITWCSANSNSVRNRTVSAAVVNMFSQAAGIISANIYRADDAPKYHTGNTILIVLAFGSLVQTLCVRQWFIYRNKQKDATWNKMTKQEQEEYIKNSPDRGNKRLDFRFSY